MIARNLCLVLVFGVTACQMKPTKVTTRIQRPFTLITDKSRRPIVLTENTVILDARSAFDYGLNRVEGSLHFPWDSIAEPTGELLRDRRKLSQRLALLGITPTKPVVVVGYGRAGGGEEGRLAWTLVHLGFSDVQVASTEYFRKHLTQNPTPQPMNVDPIEFEFNQAMLVDESEFNKIAADPKDRLDKRIFLIDVRSQKEYFNRDKNVKARPDVQALHIEWKEFFSAKDGRPNGELKKRLKSLGISDSDRIIVFSNRGARAAAAAFALISLGFHRTQIPSL